MRASGGLCALGVNLAVLLALPCGQAQTTAWGRISPPGGDALDLVISPADPRVLWAVTTLGLHRSTDAGTTWGPASTQWWLDRWPPQLAPSPVDPDAAFLCVPDKAQLRTTDGGASWRDRNRFAAPTAVAAIPGAAPFTVLAAGDGETVLRSSNLGETWTTVTTAITSEHTSSSRVHQLLPMAEGSGVLYARVGSWFCRSDDLGETWYVLPTTAGGGQGSTVVCHPRRPGVLLMTVESAGLAADEGEGAAAHAVTSLAERGLDLGGHRSRCVQEVDLAG